MGIEIGALVSYVSAGIGALSFVQGIDSRKQAQEEQEKSVRAQQAAQGEQEKVNMEKRAKNAADAAAERRAQIRQERVRRARILQSAENSGSAGSSGEFGAIGSLSTTLASNLGDNLGAIATGQRITGYAQKAAGFMGEAQDAQLRSSNELNDAKTADTIFSLSTQAFSAAGGFSNFKSATPANAAMRADFSGVDYQATRDN